MHGIIYCATNVLNGKKYIGKTIRSLEDRKRDHLSCKIDTVLSKSIQKYGSESFIGEIIDHCNDEEELNNKERKYIKEFNSHISENGYNMTGGGDGGDVISNHPQKDEIRKRLSECCIGDEHYLAKMNEEEKNEWINNNMCGENHSHKKHCNSQEEYEEGLEENQRGNNNPVKRGKTEEEFQEWLNKTCRGENHYSNKMNKEEYDKGIQRKREISTGRKHTEEERRIMSKGQLETEKGRKYKCVITCPDGTEYIAVSISGFCKDYCKINNINPIINRKRFTEIAKGKREKSYRGFWCRFYDEERDFNIPKWEISYTGD